MAVSRNTMPDTHVAGTLSCQVFVPPDGCIDDDAVEAGAGVEATKLQHQYQPILAQYGSATTTRQVVHVGYGATGSLVAARAGAAGTAAVGAATVRCNVKLNGTNVLTTGMVIDSSLAVREMDEGTFSTDTYVDDDVIEIDMVATAGGGTLPTNCFVQLVIREDPE